MTVSNDSKIDISIGSLTNLAIVNKIMENRNKNNVIDTQLQYDSGARYAAKLYTWSGFLMNMPIVP